MFVFAALLGMGAGYVATLIYRPTLIPPQFRVGSLRDPETILLLGVDVVYTELGARKRKSTRPRSRGAPTPLWCAAWTPTVMR